MPPVTLAQAIHTDSHHIIEKHMCFPCTRHRCNSTQALETLEAPAVDAQQLGLQRSERVGHSKAVLSCVGSSRREI